MIKLEKAGHYDRTKDDETDSSQEELDGVIGNAQESQRGKLQKRAGLTADDGVDKG